MPTDASPLFALPAPLDNDPVIQGALRIRQLRDALETVLAGGASVGDTGWVNATGTVITASGFTTTNARYRIARGIGQIYWTGTTVNALSAGDIANTTVCTWPGPCHTSTYNLALHTGNVGPVAAYTINPNGEMQITAVATAISAGSAIGCSGTFFVA